MSRMEMEKRTRKTCGHDWSWRWTCFHFLILLLLPGGSVWCQQRDPYVGQLTLPDKPVKLRQMNVYSGKIGLSGYSSGAAFAQQLQISYSSMFSGVGIFSQTFYKCGPGDGVQASYDNLCTKLGNVPPEEQWDPRLVLSDMTDYHIKGLIEDPRNLKNTKLYIFAGTHNWLFSVDQQMRSLEIYRPFIRNDNKIRTQIWDANHTLPSNAFGGSCLDSDSKGYYVGYCGISGAYEAVSFIHGKYAVPYFPFAHSSVALQPLHSFDQSEFFYGVKGDHLMDKIGYLYIPSKCKKYKCSLHLYFHGCRSGREFLGANHIRYSGYLQVAELNNIIMLFPQAVSNEENQIGCWDTYGLTGPYFATKKGAQVTVVRNMLARILGEDLIVNAHYHKPHWKPIPFLPKIELIFPGKLKLG